MKLNPTIEVARKDMLSFFRSKSTLFWTLTFPLLMMLLFSSMFGGRGAMFTIAVVDQDGGNVSKAFLEDLNSTNVTRLVWFSSESDAKEYVMDGRADALLIVPRGFSDNLTSGLTAELRFYTSEDPQVRTAVTNMLNGFVDAFSEEYRARALAILEEYMPPEIPAGGRNLSRDIVISFLRSFGKPVRIRIASITKPELTSETAAYWKEEGHWITVMLAYTLIFSGMVGAASLLAYEKLLGTVKRLIASPASRWSLLAGKLLGGLAILTLSQLILVLLTILWLRPELNWTPLIIPVVIAGDLASLGLGLLVVELSPNPKAASEAVTTVGIMIQFVSGLYFPLSFLPDPLRAVAEIIPFTWAVKALDGLLVMGKGLESVAAPVIYLASAALIFISLASALFPRWAEVE
ncbi:MAG: ABC transporter permease [Candidatus Korarchaeota archaeon]|nr:ABC transporter permease [Candidatus Korarchaeota archaeon]